ncbi:MAG: DUF6273 domain-containing protein [Lachnospiraceae bacterium]|nr:DUF6273 domain-containing protein [Lachnospiraceae bacterium]
MFVFKCKNCGKDIEYVRGKRIVVCSSCGKKQTIEFTEKNSPTFFSKTEVSKDPKSDADRNAVYSMGRSLMNSKTIEGYEKAIEAFRCISGYPDADDLIYECLIGIEELSGNKEVSQPEADRMDDDPLIAEREETEEKTDIPPKGDGSAVHFQGDDNNQPVYVKKNSKKIFAVTEFIIVAFTAFIIIWTIFIMPKQKKDKEEALIETSEHNSTEALPEETDDKGGTEPAKQIKEKDDWRDNCSVGDTFFFGAYEQDNDVYNGKENIEWLVLAKDDEKALVISKYALDCLQYASENKGVTWENSSLRKWLNETFFAEAFSETEQMYIQSTLNLTYDESDVSGAYKSLYTNDKVFLLSTGQANEYFDYDDERACKGTDYCYANGAGKDDDGNCRWWLRYTTNSGMFSYASCVAGKGNIREKIIDVRDSTIAVRPAMWLYFNIDELSSKYDLAVSFMDSGDYDSAYKLLKNLKFRDSVDRIRQIEESDDWIKICPVGRTFLFGSYEQDNDTSDGKENIEWIVLEKADDKALVVSKYILDCMPYDSSYLSTYISWEDSTIRKWLNETFIIEAFTIKEQERIQEATVTTKGYLSSGERVNRNTKDKVFLLNKSETEKYIGYANARVCEPTEYCISSGTLAGWWLREPCSGNCAVVVTGSGAFVEEGSYVTLNRGIRPTMWIDIS